MKKGNRNLRYVTNVFGEERLNLRHCHCLVVQLLFIHVLFFSPLLQLHRRPSPLPLW